MHTKKVDEVQDNFAEWKKSVKSCILYDFYL